MIEYYTDKVGSAIQVWYCKNCGVDLNENPCKRCGHDNIDRKKQYNASSLSHADTPFMDRGGKVKSKKRCYPGYNQMDRA